jgi:glycosyltransferase involved in cell wall biosynthesis
MKRLLALSWCMPPIVMPRSIQVSRLLAALADIDWRSDVVCVDPASLRPANNIMDDSLNRPAGGKVKKYPVSSLEDWVLVRGLIRLFPSLGILPDPKWVWKNAAFRKCDLLASSQKYDAFVSFAQPWTDHLVGLQVKEQSHLPWVVHFSDPWADSPYIHASEWVKNKRLEMEKAVVESADAVIFVSRQTADLVMQKYPDGWRSKTHIIPHGFEPLELTATAPKDANQPVEFVYSGNFYGPRTPQTLLEAALHLIKEQKYQNSFRIRFVGPVSPIIRKTALEMGLTGVVQFEGAVPFSKSQEFCEKADVLLVIDAPSESSSVFLPSKLIDYLAFNKPILGITPLRGSSADLINQLGCPVVDPANVQGISDALARFIDARRNGPLTLPEQFLETARQYHIHQAALKMDAVLSDLINRQPN